MNVQVLFFGVLKDLAGRASDSLRLGEGATISDLLGHYEANIPRLKHYLPALATSVNREYAPRTTELHDGDEVALLPPVSGGSVPYVGTRHVALVREAIDTQEIIRAIKRPEDGAVAVFEGIVRNQSRGRRTLYLEYEAYAPMAAAQLNELVRQGLDNFKIRDAWIIHRLGRLEIGETSVLVVVASAHRAAAFDACRWLIDTLKRTVPIWKKEFFEDGAVWASGEPFPENLSSNGAGRASK